MERLKEIWDSEAAAFFKGLAIGLVVWGASELAIYYAHWKK